MKLSDELADKLFAERMELIHSSLSIKAKEYVRNDDRMHNFNVAAELEGKTREEVLHGFRLKQEVSRRDLLKDIEEGNMPTEAHVREKYGDIINYFILEEMSVLHKIHEHGKDR